MNIIVNADDFGYSREFNEGVCAAFEKKLINRTTLMVNMPAAEEAVKMAFDNGFADKVGLHLNFSEGAALSEECRNSELCDENGCFKNEFYKGIKGRFFLKRRIQKAIRKECEAQILKYISYGFKLMHADSHNYTHTYWSVSKNVIPLLKKYNFRSVRISHNIPPENISVFFKVYKFIFNNIILNWKNGGEKIYKTKFFGSMEDFLQFSKSGRLNEDCEIMVHTRLNKDGKIEDVEIEGIKIMPEKEWMNKNGIIF